MKRLLAFVLREAALWASILIAIVMTLGCWVVIQQAERRFAAARTERALLIHDNGQLMRALQDAENRAAELDEQLARLEQACRQVHQ